MLCHLPIPYPDELLYSDIARYFIRIGAIEACLTADHIFGRRTRPSIDLPSSLNAVAERTQVLWHMSSEDIANSMTLFPYYAHFVPQNRIGQCLEILMSDDGQGVHARLGVNASRIKVPRFLRFCEQCRQFDISEYGETYWHRSHQLAGTLVCPQHGAPLMDSSVSMRPKAYSQYADATIITAETRPSHNIELCEKDSTIAWKIAKRCQEMLWGSISIWDTHDVHLQYRAAAKERGFLKNLSFFSPIKVKQAFVSFYGPDLLSKMGCFALINKINWIDDIFNSPRRLFPPVLHALIQLFLESTDIQPANSTFGLGPWRCPNPYANHEQAFPVTKVEVVNRNNGQLVASAKCSCGFKFTFLRVSNLDSHLPVVNRRLASGPTWVREIKRLKKEGLTTKEVASKMGMDRKTVRRILNKTSIKKSLSLKQKHGSINQRTRLLPTTPISSHRRKSPIERKFDWHGRDAEWSQQLKLAASAIRDEMPPRRVTKIAMFDKAGISSSIYSYLRRLPKCRLAITERSESYTAFQQRLQEEQQSTESKCTIDS